MEEINTIKEGILKILDTAGLSELEKQRLTDALWVLYNVSNCARRPPLGLIPKWVRQKERFEEVCQAIARYNAANKEIPIEWVKEHNELVKHYC